MKKWRVDRIVGRSAVTTFLTLRRLTPQDVQIVFIGEFPQPEARTAEEVLRQGQTDLTIFDIFSYSDQE